MHITAVLTVKDEFELINLSLDHLLEIGVDTIVVVDVASTDGTRAAIEQRLCERISLLNLHEAVSSPYEEQIRDFLEVLFRRQPTDWFLHLDADEFWLPRTGSIKDVPQLCDRSNEAISVGRFNVCLTEDRPNTPTGFRPSDYRDVLLFAKSPVGFRERLVAGNVAWSEGVPLPKVATRPDRLKNIAVTGFHSVRGSPSNAIRMATSSELIIAHLPFTTFSRFQQKVANVSRFIERRAGSNPDPAWIAPNVGWHWRRWTTLENEGSLYLEFERQTFSIEQIGERRRTGAIKSAAEMLSQSQIGSEARS